MATAVEVILFSVFFLLCVFFPFSSFFARTGSREQEILTHAVEVILCSSIFSFFFLAQGVK